MPTQREAEARGLRLEGASFRTIGGILGVSSQRAFQLVKGRQARPEQREQRQRRAEQQRALLADLHAILIAEGAISVSDWANVLNLSRSTAHSVFTAPRKNGITRATIRRMLASPQLPPQARARLTSWQILARTREKPLVPKKPDSMKGVSTTLYGVDAPRLRPPGHPPETLPGWGISAAHA